MKLLLSLVSLLPFAGFAPCAHSAYPKHWWEPVPAESAPSWEILPQQAGPGEVVLSKRNELGLLSNFAATAFELDGKEYASVEGFWQMLKFPEGPGDERSKDPSVVWPYTREEVARMKGFEAKAAGNAANENLQKLGISWVSYQGQQLDYREKAEGRFFQLIFRAMSEKMRQNPDVKKVLLRTGALKLLPDHHQPPDSPPAWKYHEIWMRIRAGHK